jgi:hypothetical protein
MLFSVIAARLSVGSEAGVRHAFADSGRLSSYLLDITLDWIRLCEKKE